jgi:hypothetical protein
MNSGKFDKVQTGEYLLTVDLDLQVQCRLRRWSLRDAQGSLCLCARISKFGPCFLGLVTCILGDG